MFVTSCPASVPPAEGAIAGVHAANTAPAVNMPLTRRNPRRDSSDFCLLSFIIASLEELYATNHCVLCYIFVRFTPD
jgi:hypothetical protein